MKNPVNGFVTGFYDGSPGWTRTSDTLINSQVLLPTELRRNMLLSCKRKLTLDSLSLVDLTSLTKSKVISLTETRDTLINSQVLLPTELRRNIDMRKCRHSPIFPRRRHLSIFGVYELNFCVRNGNRWDLTAICIDYLLKRVIKPSKLNKRKPSRERRLEKAC